MFTTINAKDQHLGFVSVHFKAGPCLKSFQAVKDHFNILGLEGLVLSHVLEEDS